MFYLITRDIMNLQHIKLLLGLTDSLFLCFVCFCFAHTEKIMETEIKKE